MSRTARAASGLLLTLVLAGGTPLPLYAQGFEPVTTRAAGMAGAFVAVADDASAVYWNPAALASGALFSLVVDHTSSKATHDEPSDPRGGSRSSTFLALTTTPVGLSYYRLRSTWVSPEATNSPSASVGESLITHHTGVTLLHSLADGLSVGATLKLVRGIATSTLTPVGTVDDLLDDADDLVGESSNKFDADAGISFVRGGLRAGLTVHNLTDPSFDAAGGGPPLELERQGRAGVALTSPLGFLIALDADLNEVRGPLGRVRELAIGSEARLVPRAFARAGFRFNTLGDEPGGHAPVLALGGSFAVLASLWIDAQATVGSESGGRGWGVAGRVAF
jgi:hypothetical protein